MYEPAPTQATPRRSAVACSSDPGNRRGLVVGLGEALIRLVPPGRQRLAQADSLDVSVGGAEVNTLVVLSQLGYATRWITRLPANPLGQLIARHARSYSVEVVAGWDAQSRAGIYFVEQGAPPRATEVLYDRSGSAASDLQAHQFDWTALTAGARAVHVTGITCALGAGPRDAARALFTAARANGVITSFDLNHRSRLWSDADAVAAFHDLLPLADVVFASPPDLALVLGRPDATGVLAAELVARFGARLAVIRESSRRGPDEITVNVQVVGEQRALTGTHVARVVDPFGAGDTAAGVFLASWLQDRDAAAAAELAARGYAHMITIPGDTWVGSFEELSPHYDGGRSILR